ncbi:site-specific integrase [Polaribacter sp. MSW13]|uniref:Site-specific integrase n=1 Tax=Polaribacter marinus TaxID=2916838 RepID=A0A9X2AID4_9FLAO|nr:tyrosine-type recombinase/integrase [Polaribacter marinus]MCI2228446.1 site-specific integrase [Polaribacter marinus]
MASIKYLIQSDKEVVQIYIRLSIGRAKYFKRKVGFTLKSVDWNKQKGMPKLNNNGNKKIASDLRGLTTFIYDALNNAASNGEQINGGWLTSQIDIHFNRVQIVDLDKLLIYCNKFISSMKKSGIALNTVKKYQTTINKIEAFELVSNKTFLVKDVNISFGENFLNYLRVDCKYQDNTASRIIGYVKTICFNAEVNGIRVSPQLKKIKGLKTVKMPFVYLTFEEIEKIKNTLYENPLHQVVADWLIISCYTGQRISDLLRMNSSMIIKEQGFEFIYLTQVKTKSIVQIPIDKNVKEILNKYKGEFPPRVSKHDHSNMVMYNRILKKVCKTAGIVEIVKGNLYNEETERMEVGMYPKNLLISSHVGRRSYASNFFGKIPTPLLMNITGHSSESMFMKYIHKTSSDMSIQLAKILSASNIK